MLMLSLKSGTITSVFVNSRWTSQLHLFSLDFLMISTFFSCFSVFYHSSLVPWCLVFEGRKASVLSLDDFIASSSFSGFHLAYVESGLGSTSLIQNHNEVDFMLVFISLCLSFGFQGVSTTSWGWAAARLPVWLTSHRGKPQQEEEEEVEEGIREE